ncbi:MAG: DUF1801 domain-containing protein [Bacteroidota bacterium]
MSAEIPPAPNAVRQVYESYPSPLRERLLALRDLVLVTAAETPGVGRIEEALRWGEPSFLTSETRSGTTVRIAPLRDATSEYGVFVNCQTALIGTFRQLYPDLFRFDGSRGLLFDADDEVPTDALAHCLALALRYHADKRDA